jgi:hypothetical protein
MTSKGHSPVDPVSAETPTSRRGLIGALGVAGLAGAAALAVARPATAAPHTPTAADSQLLEPAMRLERAARRLYRDAAEVLPESAAPVAETFAANHDAYADRFAASTGISANAYDEAFYEENARAFSTSSVTDFAVAAWTLENNLVATYTEMSNELESVQARTTVAAMTVMNARMATVLTELAGVSDDLDLVLDPPAEAIVLGADQ